MPFVDARGLRFHVQELGAPHRPPVVMLHGLFTGSLASWWFTAAPVLARSHRVRLLDLRGHGLSERPATGYDRASFLADVVALTGDLPPFAVVGHSYGALLALELGIGRPDRVTRVVAVEPPLTESEEPPTSSPDDGPAHPLESTTLVDDLRNDPPLTDEDLASSTRPVSFVFGGRSGYRAGAERVRRVLPDAPCRVLDGGHALHVDARDALSDLLLADLGEPEPVAHG